jgi:hypothetical protein
MSLKGFHLVFVTVATLLFGFLTLWAFVLCEERAAWVPVIGYVGIVGLLLTPVYGVYFLRKARQLHL